MWLNIRQAQFVDCCPYYYLFLLVEVQWFRCGFWLNLDLIPLF